MSLNIGTAACDALRTLSLSADWTLLRAELGRLVQEKIYASIEAPPDHRVDATAYSRGMRDLWVAMEAATTGKNQRVIERPRPPGAGGGSNT